MEKIEKIKIGVCGVDSGQLLVIDPCYIDSEWKKGDNPEEDFGGGTYAECCKKTIEGKFGQLKFKRGHDGLGCVFSTGFGDGLYPVYAYIKDFGEWGKRVVKVEIIME